MKRFNDYSFMSIGSNCAPILFLGPNRLRGPVDNVVIKDAYVLKFLVEGTYFSYIVNKKNYNKEKPTYFCRKDDPKFWTIYPYLCIIDLYSKDNIDGEELYQQFKTKVLEVI